MENNIPDSVEFLNEGPSELVIPEQRYMSCRRCKWLCWYLSDTGATITYCSNPVHKYDIMIDRCGKIIPKYKWDEYPQVPEWCPVINKQEEKENGTTT